MFQGYNIVLIIPILQGAGVEVMDGEPEGVTDPSKSIQPLRNRAWI